jgi:hypothetical protein
LNKLLTLSDIFVQNCKEKENVLIKENQQIIPLYGSGMGGYEWSLINLGCEYKSANNETTREASLSCNVDTNFRTSRERWWFVAISNCESKVVMFSSTSRLFQLSFTRISNIYAQSYNTIQYLYRAPFHRDTCSRRYLSKMFSKGPRLKKAFEGNEFCGCPDILWQTIPQMRPTCRESPVAIR